MTEKVTDYLPKPKIYNGPPKLETLAETLAAVHQEDNARAENAPPGKSIMVVAPPLFKIPIRSNKREAAPGEHYISKVGADYLEVSEKGNEVNCYVCLPLTLPHLQIFITDGDGTAFINELAKALQPTAEETEEAKQEVAELLKLKQTEKREEVKEAAVAHQASHKQRALAAQEAREAAAKASRDEQSMLSTTEASRARIREAEARAHAAVEEYKEEKK